MKLERIAVIPPGVHERHTPPEMPHRAGGGGIVAHGHRADRTGVVGGGVMRKGGETHEAGCAGGMGCGSAHVVVIASSSSSSAATTVRSVVSPPEDDARVEGPDGRRCVLDRPERECSRWNRPPQHIRDEVAMSCRVVRE